MSRSWTTSAGVTLRRFAAPLLVLLAISVLAATPDQAYASAPPAEVAQDAEGYDAEESSSGAIAGSVIFGMVCLVLLGGLGMLAWKARRHTQAMASPADDQEPPVPDARSDLEGESAEDADTPGEEEDPES